MGRPNTLDFRSYVQPTVGCRCCNHGGRIEQQKRAGTNAIPSWPHYAALLQLSRHNCSNGLQSCFQQKPIILMVPDPKKFQHIFHLSMVPFGSIATLYQKRAVPIRGFTAWARRENNSTLQLPDNGP